MSAFATLLKRDLRLAVREGGAIGTALGFYLVVVALIPLGLGPTSSCCRASRPACCGSRCCCLRCFRSAACSRPTTRTARSR